MGLRGCKYDLSDRTCRISDSSSLSNSFTNTRTSPPER
ncbi:hypothetical protein H6G63_17060 [Leptolyngbya sp. FACHB-402]|nr:hypothetical protein [Leptolyngbya sp. FACHB-161]MBD2375286.1 hypothetical protein [Leptolyngbya sp. FACHB-238]MBD2399704.1 hypothetical protein [Leptolyngbya sp. FACHB-239]MBD2405910.1 hypothetical protein [Leptolyngbya sp. FACHB-402]